MIDRFAGDGVDVLMLTLDAAPYLDLSLESLYREVPVKRLIVCDGGSKDETHNILRKYPRVELHLRPDLRTTGKAVEFLISESSTEWIMFTDSDHTYPIGWYDEMCRHRSEFDAFDSRRVHHYEFYRRDLATENASKRPLVGSPQMGKREALLHFKVDDDYVWRIEDIVMRQSVEKSGWKYGKVTSTYHIHHTTEETKYLSDPSKATTRIEFEPPKEIVLDKEKHKQRLIQTAKAYVKYVDPTFICASSDTEIDLKLLPLLTRVWIQTNGAAWLPRYDKALVKPSLFSRVVRGFKRRFM